MPALPTGHEESRALGHSTPISSDVAGVRVQQILERRVKLAGWTMAAARHPLHLEMQQHASRVWAAADQRNQRPDEVTVDVMFRPKADSWTQDAISKARSAGHGLEHEAA